MTWMLEVLRAIRPDIAWHAEWDGRAWVLAEVIGARGMQFWRVIQP